VLGIDIDNEEMGLDEVESVGGLLMAKLGDIPKQGQRIEFPRFDVVVKKTNGPRILLVKGHPPASNLPRRPDEHPRRSRTRSRRPARPARSAGTAGC
jgi:Mg2+/Co2+ transporter CorC